MDGYMQGRKEQKQEQKTSRIWYKREEQAIPMDIPDSGANPNQMQSHHAVFFSFFLALCSLECCFVFSGYPCKSHACR